MRARTLLTVTVVAAATMLSGCARINEGVKPLPASEQPAFSNYLENRLYDFMDMFRLQWAVPRDFKAIGAKVKATALAQAGFVCFQGKKAGLERRAVGIIRQKKVEGGIAPLYFTSIREGGEYGNHFMRTNTAWAKTRDRRIIRNGFFWSDGTGRPMSVGAEVVLLCFGGPDVQFYVCELGDFVAGLFGFDPRGDDLSRLTHAELDNEFFGEEP